MIFNSNTTALSASTIPMAEGYDSSYGTSLALVESARNEFAMFKAMINADYKEMSICKESADVVMEGEVAALHEAVGGGIFKKIADLFRKLVAKIKSIFHNFMARLTALFGKDKDLVKKYSVDAQKKANIDKVEVKFRKHKTSADTVSFDLIDVAAFKSTGMIEKHVDDAWDRTKYFLGAYNTALANCDSANEAVEEFINTLFEDEDTVKLGEVGGVRGVANFISDYAKKFKTMESNINKNTTALEKLVKEYDKMVNDFAKDKTSDADTIANAKKEYEMAVAYQNAMLIVMDANIKAAQLDYKQNKAAFMKAVTVNPKKIDETALYAEAVAEAAEQEVEDVLTGAIDKEDISDLSAATVDVKDADVSDDPDKLTYGPDCYTPSASYDDAEGKVCDTDVASREESAFFGDMFY